MRPTAVFFEPPADHGQVVLSTPPHELHVLDAEGRDLGTADSLVKEIVDNDVPLEGGWPPAKQRATPGAVLVFPDGKKEPLARIHLPLVLHQVLERTTLEQPRRPQMFRVQDVLSGGTRRVTAAAVPLLSPPSLTSGRFYANLMGQRYYCKSVKADDATLILLADTQRGHTLDVEMVQSLEYASSYYPIEDPVALARVSADLERYKKLPGQEDSEWPR
jgi:hypothetical protein